MPLRDDDGVPERDDEGVAVTDAEGVPVGVVDGDAGADSAMGPRKPVFAAAVASVVHVFVASLYLTSRLALVAYVAA